MRRASIGAAVDRYGGVRVLAGTVLALLALAAVELGAEWAWRTWLCPTDAAAFLWTPEARAGEGPVAFVAVRDFELDYPVARARLLFLADEEGQVYLNGRPVGLYRFEHDAPMAVWDVASLLLPGANRLAVELRSGQGIGAFLASLEVLEPERRRVVTAGDWRLVRRLDAQVLNPRMPLEDAIAPRVLSMPPAGRWGRPRLGPERPLLPESLADPAPLLPHRLRGELVEKWTTVRKDPDWDSPPVGHRVVFDWGREVTAYLNLSFNLTREARGLYFAGRGPRDPDKNPPSGWFDKLDGTRTWTATEPRTFRYVTVVSSAPLNGARAFVADPSIPGVRVADGEPEGVFGLDPVPLRTPAEDEIRRELESLESLANGQAP